MKQFIFLILFSIFFESTILYGQSESCYLDNRESEKGYVGQIDGIKLFYEVWNIEQAMNTHYTSVIIWTDTTRLDSIDFCFDMVNTDSIYITLIKKDTNIFYKTTDVEKIPNLFQTLLRAELNYDHYYDFNKPNSTQKIFVKSNKLYLSHLHSPNFEKESFVLTDIFVFQNGKFKFLKTTKKKYTY